MTLVAQCQYWLGGHTHPSPIPPPPLQARRGHACGAALLSSGLHEFVVAGGFGDSVDYSVQVYSVEGDEWRTETALYTPRRWVTRAQGFPTEGRKLEAL